MIETAGRLFVWPLGHFLYVGMYASVVSAAEPRDLQVGGLAPRFQAIGHDGETWKSVNHVRMQIVVVFFYQGDFRCGCVRQVHDYDGKLEALARENVVVVGVSGDTQETHRLFTDLHDLNLALLDAHRNRSHFQGESDAQLAAWLKRILTHNLTDALRHNGRAKRDVSRKLSLEAAIEDSFGHADHWLAATQSSPSERVAKNEQLVQLADAITRLPEAQQDAIVLHHLQGHTLAETALALDRTEAAVAGLLYRGLRQLHELLDESE